MLDGQVSCVCVWHVCVCVCVHAYVITEVEPSHHDLVTCHISLYSIMTCNMCAKTCNISLYSILICNMCDIS